MITLAKITLGAALATQMLGLLALPALAQTGEPSRPAIAGCAWEQRTDLLIGLGAWVQRCDFGFRQIDLFFDSGALAIDYSDGEGPDPLVQVLDLLPGEAPNAALRRLFEAGTEPAIAARCVVAPFTLIPAPVGAERFTFVPDAAYQSELDANANPDEVGEPPCGDWGVMPDGIQYFEVQQGAPRLLFVRAGQEAPLFDEQTLQILPLPDAALIEAGPEDCCGYKTDADGVSADFLMESCSVPGQTAYGMIAYFDCQSYILAVLDTVRSLNAGPDAMVCLPPVMSAGGVLRLIAESYSDETSGEKPAAAVLVDALTAAFPCAKR